ncbi:DUF2357 domain-containing protein [Levilactobacillus enshiensis]|uniref:DUF2357 domain-containing protein n=1 Tax=Levilactobacillus enshiensis TaxID=2590213 RepID=UPI00131EB6A8|nr:DUF2357 domain-containing protein [Levilactobacillus enshiensis]
MSAKVTLSLNDKYVGEFLFKKDQYDLETLEAVENKNYGILFSGNVEDRLYIDGLDLINNSRVQTDDEGKLFISPGKELVSLYDFNNNGHKYLPGIYRLQLKEKNGELFSWLKIVPKFLDDDQLDKMRQDVENTIIGLARSFSANTNGTITESNDDLSSDDYEILSILHDEYYRFQRAMFAIDKFPKSGISELYHWTRKMMEPMDSRGIREMTNRPDRKKEIFGRYRVVNYDIQYNMLLAYDLRMLLKVINELRKKIRNILSLVNNTNKSLRNLENDNKILSKYRFIISGTLSTDWMNDVSEAKNVVDKNFLPRNINYLFVKKLLKRVLSVSDKEFSFHRQYTYYWHRTDLLYEIWGYIQVIKGMKAIGFKPIKGWIFQKNAKKIDILENGTTVELSREGEKKNLKAKIIYNKKIIPNSPDRVTKENPLWTPAKHNWPDIRIDLYDEGDKDNPETLIGVLVLDTKYRRFKDISSFEEGGAGDQLVSYLDHIKTTDEYAFSSNKYAEAVRLKVFDSSKSFVDGVGVIFPTMQQNDKEKEIVKQSKEKGIFPIPLKTNENDDALIDFLKQEVKSITQNANEWSRIGV